MRVLLVIPAVVAYAGVLFLANSMLLRAPSMGGVFRSAVLGGVGAGGAAYLFRLLLQGAVYKVVPE